MPPAGKKVAIDPDDVVQVEEEEADQHAHESEEWKEAYQYAIKKGNSPKAAELHANAVRELRVQQAGTGDEARLRSLEAQILDLKNALSK
jgi:phage terminase small subunit